MRVLCLFMILSAFALTHARSEETCSDPAAPCPVDERLEMADIDTPREARQFLRELREAAEEPDKARLVSMVRYPFSTYEVGTVVKTYDGPDQLLAYFGKVFTPVVLQAIEKANYGSLFIRDQGAMIGDGEVWFAGGPDGIRITAINPS